jgi:predicted nucleotidyltransferase
METHDRLAVARSYTQRLAAHYGDELRLAAVTGSVARGEDTPFSDLDLLLVSANGAIASRSLIFQGWPINIKAMAEAELTRQVQEPDAQWPQLMGMLDHVRVLQGHTALPERWLMLGRSLTRDQRRAGFERNRAGTGF